MAKKKAASLQPKLTEVEQDLLSHIQDGYQLETDSLGGNPILRRLKDNEEIRPLSANRNTIKAMRDGRWVFLDFKGKGNKVRSVAVPLWVKQAIDGWLDTAGIEKGPIFRRVAASGRVGEDALTERAVWQLVREYAAQVGIGELAPHDLRRTAAKLCRAKGGELEQIQFLLGHESILTTERYLGSEQDLKNAVNDALVFD
jgi:integrase